MSLKLVTYCSKCHRLSLSLIAVNGITLFTLPYPQSGIPGGRVCFVGEVPGEETFCAAAGVACFEENVMEDVGEREGLVGAGNPCCQSCVQLDERGVIS